MGHLHCDRDWQRWFASERIEPLRITYDSLAKSPIETLPLMPDRLGLDRRAATGVEPGVARLADATRREWVARFRSQLWWRLSPGVAGRRVLPRLA
ncbi:MAG: Stf0 family sulfotransferase [Pseudomonadota bacterium]